MYVRRRPCRHKPSDSVRKSFRSHEQRRIPCVVAIGPSCGVVGRGHGGVIPRPPEALRVGVTDARVPTRPDLTIEREGR